jgi:hypothetical protein
MNIPTIDCNICGLRLITEGSRLRDGLTLYGINSTGSIYSKVGLSNCHQDGNVHLCRWCLSGLGTVTPEAIEHAERYGTWSPTP